MQCSVVIFFNVSSANFLTYFQILAFLRMDLFVQIIIFIRHRILMRAQLTQLDRCLSNKIFFQYC